MIKIPCSYKIQKFTKNKAEQCQLLRNLYITDFNILLVRRS